MSFERTDKRRHRRRLSQDEHKLWSGITRSIVPLKRKPSGPHGHDAILPPGERAPPPPARRRAEPAPMRHPAAKSTIKLAGKPALPVIGLDRRHKQRLSRGTETIDFVSRPHGQNQNHA